MCRKFNDEILKNKIFKWFRTKRGMYELVPRVLTKSILKVVLVTDSEVYDDILLG